MPNYTFERASDGARTSKKLTFAEYDQVKAGDLKLVDDNGESLTLVFDPSGVGFVLKDGPSGGWAGKSDIENKYRKQRSKLMAKRERDHVFKSQLVPNLNGQEASSWTEVQNEVKATKGELAASTYNAQVAKETKA